MWKTKIQRYKWRKVNRGSDYVPWEIDISCAFSWLSLNRTQINNHIHIPWLGRRLWMDAQLFMEKIKLELGGDNPTSS